MKSAKKTTEGWSDPSIYLQHIHVEEQCLDYPYTNEIIERAGLPWSIIKSGEPIDIVSGNYPDNLSKGKKHLFLCRNNGKFFKPCPGTREYKCCDYQVLNIGMNCPMDCVYCILQAYLNTPWLTFFVNVENMKQELDQAFRAEPERFFRIGTGEFTDSMALDRITRLSSFLVDYMAEQKQAVLELKTKSTVIENLKDLNHNGRTVIAWSLNAPDIIQQEEIRASNLKQRLEAARQCAEWGYHLAFHFDPIIEHPGWQEGYEETIRQLFATVPAESIAWISMGALRYLPDLKNIATDRFTGSRIFYNEYIDGLDGKKRYFRFHRVELYHHIYKLLKEKASPRTCIYFCMESDEIWQEVMGFVPDKFGGIAKMLDRTVE